MSMNKSDPKIRLTVTVDEKVLVKAKDEARRKQIPLSRVVENFLKFLSRKLNYALNVGG